MRLLFSYKTKDSFVVQPDIWTIDNFRERCCNFLIHFPIHFKFFQYNSWEYDTFTLYMWMCVYASEDVRVLVETKDKSQSLEVSGRVGWQQACVRVGFWGLKSIRYMYNSCVLNKGNYLYFRIHSISFQHNIFKEKDWSYLLIWKNSSVYYTLYIIHVYGN